jgi:hypothetical protein
MFVIEEPAQLAVRDATSADDSWLLFYIDAARVFPHAGTRVDFADVARSLE